MLKGLNCLLSKRFFEESSVGAELLNKPLGFIDIGARGGVHPLIEPLAGCTSVLAFDPDTEECARLQAELSDESPFASIQIRPVALADTVGEATLYRFTNPTNDSLLPENPFSVERYHINTFRRVGTIPVQTTTLDKVLYEEPGITDNIGEFLKIDVQGAEYQLLKGATKTLTERTLAIVVETVFFPLYQGQKLFSDIELYLRNFGFSFYGFHGIHYRSCKSINKKTEAGKERAFWADAVFFKDPLSRGIAQKQLSERDCYVLFACALLTGYYDFALEIALKTWAKEAEAERIKQIFHYSAHFDPAKTYQDLFALADRVRVSPDNANFEVGRFVDNRRHINDYDDVPPYRKV